MLIGAEHGNICMAIHYTDQMSETILTDGSHRVQATMMIIDQGWD